MAPRKKSEKSEDKKDITIEKCEKAKEVVEKVQEEKCEEAVKEIIEENIEEEYEAEIEETFDDIEIKFREKKKCELINVCKKHKKPLMIASGILAAATLIGTVLYVTNRKE